MANYYQYETSPRKIDTRRKIQPKKKTKKVTTKNSNKTQKRTNKNDKELVKTTQTIFVSVLVFVCLTTICIRYAMINVKLATREKLKKNISEIEKENDQLKVSIERDMNITNIEQEAKEKLGMQKLTNSQKVYVNLDKKDYVELSQNYVVKEETWLSKIIKKISGK